MRRFRQLNSKRKVVASATALVLAGGIASVGLATIAQAAPKTPTPTITGGPSGTVASSSATFTFTDSASPVSFQCALDAGSFSSCTSPHAFTGLGQGSHTFRVNATTPGKSVSNDTTRTWMVDTRAPAITVTSPASGAAYNVAGWAGACSGGGICGTATDPSGVSQVTVAVLQQSTGRYWNGSTGFSSSAPAFNPATGSATWRYGLGLPSDGTYTASVRARDSHSTATAQADQVNVTFRIDRVAPSQPVLTNTPDNPTDKTAAQFNWSSSESGLSYRCALDGAALSTCAAAGTEYKNLAVGDHCFSLAAVDAAGNASTTATYCWTVLMSGGFKITGNVVGLLAPGVRRPVNLVITNPLNFTIEVTSVTVTLDPETSNAGCPASNFAVVHSLVGSVTIPANATRSLEDLVADQTRWPLVEMLNTRTSQDACKQATFTLTYSGTAAKS